MRFCEWFMLSKSKTFKKERNWDLLVGFPWVDMNRITVRLLTGSLMKWGSGVGLVE